MAYNPQHPPVPPAPPAGPARPATNGQAQNGQAQGARPVPVPAQPSRGAAPIPLPPGTTVPLPRTDVHPQHNEDQLSLGGLLKNAPPWMVSGVFHMLLLIVLGLIFLSTQTNHKEEFISYPHYADELGDPEGRDAIDHTPETPTLNNKLALSDGPQVDDPFSAPAQIDVSMLSDSGSGRLASTDQVVAPAIGNNLKGRDQGSRDALLKKYGGTALTEECVQEALRWLAKQQLKEGSWSLSGPYSEGVQPGEPASATAMALLAFQGNGNTHQRGKYQPAVDKGRKWLVDRQMENGSWRADSVHHRLYMHGQCTIALCELYGMTKDSILRGPAEKAVKYCVETQGREGGWRYNPSDGDSDTSVTGWILMGLQSARMAGIEVPDRTFKRVGEYLDTASTDGGSHYGYIPKADSSLPSMTAEALLCRQYLGWTRDNKKMIAGMETLLLPENLPRWERFSDASGRGRDVYYWYYATQMLHHMEGQAWEKWNPAMRSALISSQVKSGAEKGSWPAEGDKWGPYGGRLYVTCLCTYMLEVYYRHLPLYSSVKLR